MRRKPSDPDNGSDDVSSALARCYWLLLEAPMRRPNPVDLSNSGLSEKDKRLDDSMNRDKSVGIEESLND